VTTYIHFYELVFVRPCQHLNNTRYNHPEDLISKAEHGDKNSEARSKNRRIHLNRQVNQGISVRGYAYPLGAKVCIFPPHRSRPLRPIPYLTVKCMYAGCSRSASPSSQFSGSLFSSPTTAFLFLSSTLHSGPHTAVINCTGYMHGLVTCTPRPKAAVWARRGQ
jgi:hypothetical protein